MSKITRKVFLRGAAAGLGGLAAACLLPGCAGDGGQVGFRPQVMKFYPDISSRVVHAHSTKAWNGDELDPVILGEMLDASIVKLTGLEDAKKAWTALFHKKEKIAIKVNTIRNALFWTHPPLVQAVTERLQRSAGVPAENIIIFDREEDELVGAGYTLNKDGAGVRCMATGKDYTEGFTISGIAVKMSNIVMNCDALINMPLLKCHSLAGYTFAMKNHYGTFNAPETFHGNTRLIDAVAGLNAFEPVQQKTRLIIGDMLTACLREERSWPYWATAEKGDSILMSFDPVAHDAVGLDYFVQLKEERGEKTDFVRSRSAQWLARGRELGVGTDEAGQRELIEFELG
jgi:hypothetical protein